MLKKLLLLLAVFALISGTTLAASLPARATTIRSIAIDAGGHLWVATFGSGLWLKDNSGTRKFFDAETKQPFPMINGLLISGKRLFIATAGGGCVVLNTESLQFEAIKQAVGFEKLHALTESSTGDIYIGSVGSGTALLQNGVWVSMTDNESSQLAWVNSIVEWQGSLWLGTATGLYENKIGSPWKPASSELRRAVNCLLVHENILYVGTTDRGVYAIKPGEYPKQLTDTMGPVNFLTIHADRVIAGGDLGIWSIQNSLSTEITTDITAPKCAFSDRKNKLFLGTADGRIYLSEDGKNFRHFMSFTEQGLEENK